MLALSLSRRCFSARLRASRPFAGSEELPLPDPDPDPDPVEPADPVEPVLPVSGAAILDFLGVFWSYCLLVFHL